jgi:hypothetical protein
MRVLLVTAPMVQINTPYPATAYLKGFLDGQAGVEAIQADPALLLIERLFSKEALALLKKKLPKRPKEAELAFFIEAFDDYANNAEHALRYLRGLAPELTETIARRDFFPEGPRFQPLHEGGPYLEKFAKLPATDRAQHVASLFLDDLADFYKIGDDPRFEFARYGERLAASQASFDLLYENLLAPPTLVDQNLETIARELLDLHKPDLLCISAPFAGTVYAALRMGKIAKAKNIPVAMGGGYPNTELRRLSDPRVFDFVDFITLDDGERPLLCLLDHLKNHSSKEKLFRTFYRDGAMVKFAKDPSQKDLPFRETGTPSYAGLPVKNYIPMFEMLNPVNRLWTGYFWNKLTLAHGCYWHRCTFCDTTLDYIGRYEAQKAETLADQMESIARETGCDGFHFVDEAAPPALLRALSEELIKRNASYRWWGNVRFDKAFTPELTKLMKKAGCIAVTGGLEVASPRVLKLIDKGVTVEQVAKVTKAFQEADIFVHAYLMYGFPTQSVQETVDSLEVVRQLFQNNCLQSAFWHRFAATVHSPVGKDPKKFGIEIIETIAPKNGHFAENDLLFEDPTKADHERLGIGLRAALYNYMHGIGLEFEVRRWFPDRVPKTQIPATFIADAL